MGSEATKRTGISRQKFPIRCTYQTHLPVALHFPFQTRGRIKEKSPLSTFTAAKFITPANQPFQQTQRTIRPSLKARIPNCLGATATTAPHSAPARPRASLSLSAVEQHRGITIILRGITAAAS